MSCSFSFHFCRTPLQQSRNPSVSIVSHQKLSLPSKLKAQNNDNSQTIKTIGKAISNLAIHFGSAWVAVAEPALAVTGMNNNEEEDIIWILIQLGISAFIYFLVVPPIVMNWMRVRWYRRNLAEMYLQFMFVFMFFPGLLLWAPFLNFRKFPRDPDMKNPWDRPKDPSLIKSEYRKYPWATPEDYD